jgi:acetate kinase
VFTGGIGENSIDVRKACCDNMQFIGIDVDDALNGSPEKEKNISRAGTKVNVLVIPTNEELVIALDTVEIVENLKKG